MGRKISKPLSKTEIKILIYNKMKQKGLSYEQARAEVDKEVQSCLKVSS